MRRIAGVLLVALLIGSLPAAAATGCGSRIAFIGHRDRKSAIFTIKPNGDGLRRLTKFNERSIGLLEWSPDASRLVHARSASPDNSQIVIMSRNGATEEEITEAGGKRLLPNLVAGGESTRFRPERRRPSAIEHLRSRSCERR